MRELRICIYTYITYITYITYTYTYYIYLLYIHILHNTYIPIYYAHPDFLEFSTLYVSK